VWLTANLSGFKNPKGLNGIEGCQRLQVLKTSKVLKEKYK